MRKNFRLSWFHSFSYRPSFKNRGIFACMEGFKGQGSKEKRIRTTKEWPVQKYNWRDFTAKRGGFYRYKISPMIGKVDNLKYIQIKNLR